MNKNILLSLTLTALLAGHLYAEPTTVRNPPVSCDPTAKTCSLCPPKTSGVNNGCVQVTLALGKTSVLSDQRDVQLKIFTTAASPSLATPEELHVVMGYTFQHLGSAATAAGAPSTVDFVQSGGEKLQFTFAEGSSIGIPTPGVYKDLPERVQMVDANGWATLTEPVYYDLYPGDGSVWRFMATDLTGDLGKLVSYTDPRGRVLTNDDFGVDIVRASNGLLRQVLTPSRLADIVTHAGGYTVSVYPLTDTDTPSFANGLYAIPAHDAVEVLTVDRGDDVNHLTVTLRKGGASALKYEYTYVNGDWTLVNPDGVVEQKDIYYGDDEDTAQLMHVTRDSAGHVLRQTDYRFVSKSWGFAATNRVEGFGSATRSTSWTYVGSGAAIGKVSEKKDSTGAVVQYAYDANGRCVTETHPNRGEVVTTSYVPVDPADKLLLNDTRPRTVTRTINAIEVERTYYAYLPTQEIVERAATQGAAYGAAGNLRTVTTWYPAAEDDYAAGRVKSVRYEDGQMDIYTYSWVNSIWTETVTRVHEQEPDPVAMQTTRRLNIYSRVGNLVEQRTELMTAAGVWEQIDGVAYEYNVTGRETKRTTFNGLITTSEWAGTCCGKSSETAPDGTRATFTYDDSGRLIVRTVLDPNPIETHIGYDALGRQTVTWTTNRVAHLGTTPLRTTYDALGRVVSSIDQFGNTTPFAYSGDERTRTVTNPNGATQTTVTDESGRPISVSGTAVAPRTYTYGVNADGSQWTKVYNGSDTTAPAWTKTTENLFGRTIRGENPGFGNTLLTTTYTYDNGGRELSQTQTDTTNPVNPVILSKNLSQYDLHGDLIFSALDVNHNGLIDFAGPDRVTGFTTAYIVKNNALWKEATQVVYPDFNSDRTVTTAKSRQKLTSLGDFFFVSESEDIRGNVTTTTQAVDRNTGVAISSTIVPTSIQPQVQIQNFGQLVATISTAAITNRTAYDALNRPLAVTDGRSNTSTTTYNALSQIAYTEDAATNRTTFVYDQFGRVVETINGLNQSTHVVYDFRGNVIKQYGATYPVWYEYDVQGRMVAMATTRDTTLDPATVDSLDHPSLDVTRWVYDPATGLLTQKLYDDDKGPSYTYTPDGKLATRTWARGVVTEYGYDVFAQLSVIDYSDTTPDVTYAYDRLGRQLSAIAAGVSTNLYAYSTNTLELVSETQNGVVINRSRDAFGRESGIALESDYDVGYGYDTFGRFVAVTHEQSTNTFEYSYLPGSSHVSGMTASTSHVWTRAYESNRNLITAVTNSFNGNLISAFDYANDSIGRRTARLDMLSGEVAITNGFGYNVRSEVTSANMGTNTYGYAYDSIGNRITATNNAEVASYTANALNQYTAISNAISVLPVHDDDGNMLTNGIFSYTWDGENRLHSVVSNDVPLVTYTYDYRSRRIGKVAGETTHSFLYDGWNLIQETIHHSSFIIHNFYVWGLDLSGSLQGAGGVGGLLAVISPLPLGDGQGEGCTAYLPCYDANGNVCEYSSTCGCIVGHYKHSPVGETVAQSGELADSFAFRFSTKYRESEENLYYYGYRYYSPELGRFICRDPIHEVGGNNLFVFRNDMISFVDVLGLSSYFLKYKADYSLDVLDAIANLWNYAEVSGQNLVPKRTNTEIISTTTADECCPGKIRYSETIIMDYVDNSSTPTINLKIWNSPEGTTMKQLQLYLNVLRIIQKHEEEHISIYNSYRKKMNFSVFGTGEDCSDIEALDIAKKDVEEAYETYMDKVVADWSTDNRLFQDKEEETGRYIIVKKLIEAYEKPSK